MATKMVAAWRAVTGVKDLHHNPKVSLYSVTEKGQRTGLVILAYFQNSRGLEVALKSPVLCSVSQVPELVALKRPVLCCVSR